MARISIDGLGIEYELLGEPGAPAVALTPGGRFSKDSPGLHELGAAVASGGRRVLLWDRPNCGASDLSFGVQVPPSVLEHHQRYRFRGVVPGGHMHPELP